MSALLRRARESGLLQGGIVPASIVLVSGIAVVLLRPALPIDETRYLEVFRESLRGSPVLLRLLGEPYAEKPPLLFWLGRMLTWAGFSPELALRCVPVVATALTVVFAYRVGARTGSSDAGWFQAALWLPSLAGQFLIFDPLLALGVWGAVDAWVSERDVHAACWSAVALLAKGPVAWLFLVAFLWSAAPLRLSRAGAARRATLALFLAAVPLVSWALTAAALGGPDFARALLLDRWAGRLVAAHEHVRPFYFYVPIALLGALPGTVMLLRHRSAAAPEWFERLSKALLALLVVFSLISGKQAHYLVPAAPGLALLCAWKVRSDPRALAWLRAGVRGELALLLGVAAAGLLSIPHHPENLGSRGCELVAQGAWWLPLALMAFAVLAGLAATLRARSSARALLAVALATSGTSLLALHDLAGELLYPHALAEALRAAPADLALLGTSHHGLYALLSGRERIDKLMSEDELAPWIAHHPEGWLLVDPKHVKNGLPPGLVEIARDKVHRFPVLVLRRDSAS